MDIEGPVSLQQNVIDLLLCLDDPGLNVGTLFEVHVGVVVYLEDVVSSPVVVDTRLEDVVFVWSEVFKDVLAV